MGIEKVNKHLGELFFYALTKNLIKDKNIHQSLQELSVILDLKNVEMMPLLNHKDFDDLMEPLLNDAAQRCLFEPNTLFERDAFEAKIIDALMPRPNEVKSQFQTLYANNPEDATHYLYRLSVDVNYIKSKRLKNNIEWIHPSIYGLLQMTINLAKPEKDPKEIAASRNREEPIYEHRPQCVLCKENERNYWNARMNLRMVPITLGHEQWHFQYSPYLYYPEHAIILHDEHRPMKICAKTFDYLLDFIDQFPTYFIGSNADLPIVGGSILNHDHFQGGKHRFPLEEAPIIRSFGIHNEVEIEHLKWPLSTIRLRSMNRQKIADLACKYFTTWQVYDNPLLNIHALTDQEPHNTITPILRRKGPCYEMDLILRNNRTSRMYPLGIFHPHQDVHHIKKENIGLIEAMGLAILPGRLKEELQIILKALQDGDAHLSEGIHVHESWYQELKSMNKTFSFAQLLIEVGKKFERVLEDSGVFKLTQTGIDAVHAFIEKSI